MASDNTPNPEAKPPQAGSGSTPEPVRKAREDSALHQFDAFLCRHARDNVCWNLDHKGIARGVAKLDPKLAAYVQAGHPGLANIPPVGRFLLSYDELDNLFKAVANNPDLSFDGLLPQPNRHWVTMRDYLRDSTLCTGEIRRGLTTAEAETWASESNRWTEILTKEKVLLSEGLIIVRDWVEEIRRYLQAMDKLALIPPPAGYFPTPTNPSPNPPVTLPDDSEPGKNSSLDRMRWAIAQHEKGAEATADALIKMASINKQAGRKALRELEQLGEYKGFGKSKAPTSHR